MDRVCLDNSVNQLNVSQVLDYRCSNKTVVSCDRQSHRDRVGATQKQKQHKNTPQNKTKQETPKKIKNHNKKTQKAVRRATWRRLRRRGVATAFFCALFFGFLFFLVSLFCFFWGGCFCVVFVFLVAHPVSMSPPGGCPSIYIFSILSHTW